MKKSRYVNTKFWDDEYIVNLDPIEKLLFIYFLTNSLTNIAGAYEISLRRIAFDTGIDSEMTKKILDRFSEDKKMFYKDGWVVICNFIKHQEFTKSPKIRIGIASIVANLPDKVLKGIDRVCIAYEYSLNYSNSNSNSNLNSNSNNNKNTATSSDDNVDDINKVFDVFYKTINPTINFGNKTSRTATKELIKKFGLKEVISQVEYAVSINGQRFAPTITTPYQLKEKWAQLETHKKVNAPEVNKLTANNPRWNKT